LAVADGVAVGRRVGVVVTVARAVGVALAVDDALALEVGVSVGLAVAELLPVLPPDEGEGVRDAPAEAVLVVTPGVGVKTDGTVEEGDPPPEQAAIATASRAAPTVARPARSRAARVIAGQVRGVWTRSGGVSAGQGGEGRVCCGRIGAGQLASGTVRRTFMKPPRMTGGQWRGATHLSMCQPNRQ
jgi:hypothetical protein